MKVVMEAEKMRSLLKRICQFGSRCAKSKGFNIDFEHGLHIWAGMNIWHLGCISDVKITFVDGDDNFVNFGAKLMSYVPAIDRFEAVPPDVAMKSPVRAKCIEECNEIVRIPLVDDFAYKFSSIALDMILHRLMKCGVWAEVENPDTALVQKKLDEESKEFTAVARQMTSLKKTMTAEKFIAEIAKMINEHDARCEKLYSMMQPVKIPLVPKPCTDFNELNIILDCNDIW